MKIEKIPTMLEISATGCEDLDEATAVEHFLDKNKEDVYAMLSKSNNLDFYTSDLIWMGEAAFSYYSKIIFEYIQGLPEDQKNEEIESYEEIIAIRNKNYNHKGIDKIPPRQ